MLLWILQSKGVGGGRLERQRERAVTWADVSVDSRRNPQRLQIRLRVSKTDQERKDTSVFVGKTGCALCPVAAVLDFVAERGSGAGPLFHWSNGVPLTRRRLNDELKLAVESTGSGSSHTSTHSLRAGAASEAAAKGVGDATIQALGRWRSAAYRVYIRPKREELARLSKTIARPRSQSHQSSQKPGLC